ncbi:Beta-glucuronosyltransferase GlcAT14C [Gracilariopsis chorda]|uniref:Beta-glucuronosyltransferase GlcAT14C n=1 Tax=Gracilariopsis chorda TaxID=448386 RepID=A0A2V3J3R6_9FLOR|nr:Beta-glucuronosyltransferase GlcAT14C [Gracilariopsis chorda]|eukprot:PXF48953.1 Beta-glucuronosyltransferase GlcAT14C [Gracilariopsis chorda]
MCSKAGARRVQLPRSALLYPLIALALLVTLLLNLSHLRSLLLPAHQKDANIAYFIQITPHTLAHLPRLYSTIHHPYNLHALHFDVQIPSQQVTHVLAQLRLRNANFERDTIVIPPRKLVYDGISMVLNTLHAMSYMLKRPNWHYFINLSGHDYPLVPPEVQRKLLGSVRSLDPLPNFLSMSSSKRAESVFYDRASTLFTDTSLCYPPTAPHLPHEHPVCNELAKSTTPNPIFDHSFRPAYSGAWLIVSRQFCENATTSSEARHLLVAFANMRGSDEFFFATLARYNAQFNKTLIPKALRKVIWVADGEHAGQHPFFVDEQHSNGSYRFLKPLNESIDFFARKFGHSDSAFMDVIDHMARDAQRVDRISQAFGWIVVALKRQMAQRA